MRIDKRRNDSIDIYYIHENYMHRYKIIGFIMETTDRGMDVAFNSQWIFLIKNSIDLISKEKSMPQLLKDIKDHLDDFKKIHRMQLKNLDYKKNFTDPVIVHYIVGEFCPNCLNPIEGRSCKFCNREIW